MLLNHLNHNLRVKILFLLPEIDSYEVIAWHCDNSNVDFNSFNRIKYIKFLKKLFKMP